MYSYGSARQLQSPSGAEACSFAYRANTISCSVCPFILTCGRAGRYTAIVDLSKTTSQEADNLISHNTSLSSLPRTMQSHKLTSDPQNCWAPTCW
jgi:hypothetical protein